MYWWTIIGAVLLGVAIAWAALNNRQSRREEQRTEDATRELYKEQDAADKAEGPQ
jgi:HAMP domain-containing protein